MKLVDSTGTLVDVPDEEASKAIESGTHYAVTGDGRVNVRLVNGGEGTIPVEEVGGAVKAGSVSLIGPKEVWDKKVDEQTKDAPAAAFTMGVLRSASLGASDVVAAHVDRDIASKVKSQNPGMSLAGEVGGMLLPWGAGGLLAKAGASAAKKIAPVLGSKVTPWVTQGIVEGAGQGAGQGVSKLALDDKPLTVERIFTTIGGGMLDGVKWGAVGGLGGAGIAKMATAGRAGLSKAQQTIATKATPSITDDVLETVASGAPKRNAAADATIRAERKVVGEALDAERAAVGEARAAAGAKGAAQADEATNAWSKAQGEVGDRFRGNMEKVDTWSRQALRRADEKVPAHFDDLQRAELKAARDELFTARQATKDALGFDTVAAKQVGKRGKELAKDGPKAYQWSKPDEEVLAALRAPDSPIVATIRRQEAALERLKFALDGKPMPRVGVADDAIGTLSTPKPDVDAIRAQATASVDSAKLTELETRFADLERMVAPETKLAAKLDHAKKVVEVAEKTGLKATDEAIEAAAQAQGYDALTWSKLPADAKTTLKAQYYQHAARAELKARRGAGAGQQGAGRELGGAIAGVAVDWVLGGTLGPVLSGLVGSRLGGLIKGQLFGGVKGKLAENALKAADTAAKGVDKFLAATQKASAYVPRTTRAVLTSAALNPRASEEKPKTSAEAWKVRSRELAAAVADPQGTERAILDNLGHAVAADVALGDKLVTAAKARLAFLHEKMPKDPSPASAFGGREYQPSDAELAKWSRYVAASDDPMGVLSEEMAAGALSVETVETVKALYPAMYEDIKGQLVARAAELREGLSWPQRLTLSTFFDVPVDSVVRPDMVASLQATFAPSEPDTGGGKPGAQAPKLNASRLTSTPTQELTEAQRLSS